MTRRVTALTLAAALSLTPLTAFGQSKVEEIDVQVDLAALQDIDAAKEWANIEGDLESAIAERLVGLLSDEGSQIVIDVDELELANSFESSVGIDASKLVGDVVVRTPGLLNDEKYTLTVTATEARPYVPADVDATILHVGSKEFYQSMIAAFADRVAEKMKE